MGRTVAIEFRGYDYDVAVDGASSEDGQASEAAAAQGWEAHFAHYREDASGRLVYFWQPAIGSLAGLRNDMTWIRAHPRPHLDEVYDRVDLVDIGDLDRRHLAQTLHHVTLLEALEGLVEVLKARDVESPPC